MVSRLVRRALAALATLTLAACGSAMMTRLAYDNAALAYSNFGSAITWTADDYVDLTDTQEAWVKERAARAMSWHRAEELPRYRRFLEEQLAKSAAPFTPEDVATQQAAVRASYYRALEQIIPDMAEFFATMDAAQVAQMEKRFAEENAKFVKESIRGTPEERRERREKRFANHLEAWVGSLTGEQHDRVDACYRELRDLSEEFLGERRFRQTEMLALARNKPPRAEIEAQLKRLLVDVDSWRRPELKQALRERDARYHALLSELSGTMTAKQRAALQSRIRGLVRDIANLTASS